MRALTHVHVSVHVIVCVYACDWISHFFTSRYPYLYLNTPAHADVYCQMIPGIHSLSPCLPLPPLYPPPPRLCMHWGCVLCWMSCTITRLPQDPTAAAACWTSLCLATITAVPRTEICATGMHTCATHGQWQWQCRYAWSGQLRIQWHQFEGPLPPLTH